MSNSLAKLHHDEMTQPASPLAHFELTPYTLSLRPGITLDAWGDGLHWLATVERSAQWWVGDAWVAGDAVWGERAAQYMERYANGTIRNCAVVCRRFDATWRERYKAALDADLLSFAHFQRLTSIKDDYAVDNWLALAQHHNWSAARMAAEMGGEVGGRATVSLSLSNMSLNASKLAGRLSAAKLGELIDELMKLRRE